MNRQKREALRDGGSQPDRNDRPGQPERNTSTPPREQVKGSDAAGSAHPKHETNRPAGRMPLPD